MVGNRLINRQKKSLNQISFSSTSIETSNPLRSKTFHILLVQSNAHYKFSQKKMHSLSLGAAFLASALLTSALPTGTDSLVPRACATEYPSLHNHIMDVYPDRSDTENFFDVNYGYVVEGKKYRSDQLVRFDNIPGGSYGCQLELVFPAGQEIFLTGKTKVNVFTVDRDATATDTWGNSPQKVSLFGTVDFNLVPNQPFKRVINSAVCKPSMSFRFSLESTTDLGEVLYYPRQDGPGKPGVGLRITHNC